MSFQIINAEGQSISMKALDADAALLWGKEVDPKWYASVPVDTEGMSPAQKIRAEMTTNWFDTIGYLIHSPESNYTSGWDNVKCSLWTIQIKGYYDAKAEEFPIIIQVIQEYLKPLYNLIDFWASKGYQPKRIKE